MFHNPQPFIHPELVSYPNFDLSNYPILKMTRKDGFEKIIYDVTRERKDLGLSILKDLYNPYYELKIKISGELVKKHIIEGSRYPESDDVQTEETWYSTSGVTATRKLENGVLSCTDGPAVIIRTFSPHVLERQEFWTRGELKSVVVMKDDETVYSESWGNGILQTKVPPMPSPEVLDLANRPHRDILEW